MNTEFTEFGFMLNMSDDDFIKFHENMTDEKYSEYILYTNLRESKFRNFYHSGEFLGLCPVCHKSLDKNITLDKGDFKCDNCWWTYDKSYMIEYLSRCNNKKIRPKFRNVDHILQNFYKEVYDMA